MRRHRHGHHDGSLQPTRARATCRCADCAAVADDSRARHAAAAPAQDVATGLGYDALPRIDDPASRSARWRIASLDVTHSTGPLLTRPLANALLVARDGGAATWTGSLDLQRSEGQALLATDSWQWHGQAYPYPSKLKDRTIYHWDGDEFAPVSRFGGALIKLVPTEWGAPTFEIDGIKMLPSAQLSPFEDARRKVALIEPRGKRVLDTCGGLGYFAACALEAGVTQLHSFEKNADVLWLRTLNPWSPDPAASDGRLQLEHADVGQAIGAIASDSVDALLHDPPRFGIAGELYSQAFYDQLARVLRRGGRLFHYTGSPNKLTSGRDVPREVAKRLEKAGFRAELALDGVLATRR